MEGVQRVLDENLAQVGDPLFGVLQPRVAGGKRLRAALVMLVCRMLNASPDPLQHLAAAVEMLHSATLVHDDILDCSSVRRGSSALHTVWPVPAAVLAGDYLLARSTAIVAALNHPAVLKVFAEALCTLCAGEIRQMFVTLDTHTRRDEYYHSIEAKTAALFATAMQMAGMLAAASEAQTAALTSYGRQLGMAFQIADDVLDLVANEAEMGKPAGSDLRQGLATLPVLLYLDLDGVQGDGAVQAVLDGQRDEAQVQAALRAIRSSGAITAALAEAQVYVRRAQEALLTLPDTPPRHVLTALAEYVVARDY